MFFNIAKLFNNRAEYESFKKQQQELERQKKEEKRRLKEINFIRRRGVNKAVINKRNPKPLSI